MGIRSSSQRSSRRFTNNPAMILVGVGLLLTGLAAMFALPSTQSTAAVNDEASMVPVTVDYPSPELTLNDLQGNPHSLVDYRGQVVLVNLWATWCPPCKADMPVLQTFYDQHITQGFTIIAIEDGEPIDEVVQFVREFGLTFPVWTDPRYESERAFRTNYLPSSYVIDRNQKVRLAWTGAISQEMLEKFVTPIISE